MSEATAIADAEPTTPILPSPIPPTPLTLKAI